MTQDFVTRTKHFSFHVGNDSDEVQDIPVLGGISDELPAGTFVRHINPDKNNIFTALSNILKFKNPDNNIVIGLTYLSYFKYEGNLSILNKKTNNRTEIIAIFDPFQIRNDVMDIKTIFTLDAENIFYIKLKPKDFCYITFWVMQQTLI